MLNAKQENCEFQLLKVFCFLVRLGKGIEPKPTDYEADAPKLRDELATARLS